MACPSINPQKVPLSSRCLGARARIWFSKFSLLPGPQADRPLRSSRAQRQSARPGPLGGGATRDPHSPLLRVRRHEQGHAHQGVPRDASPVGHAPPGWLSGSPTSAPPRLRPLACFPCMHSRVGSRKATPLSRPCHALQPCWPYPPQVGSQEAPPWPRSLAMPPDGSRSRSRPGPVLPLSSQDPPGLTPKKPHLGSVFPPSWPRPLLLADWLPESPVPPL